MLSESKTIDGLDYILIKSRLTTIELEERDREKQLILQITYTYKQIAQFIYSYYYSTSMPTYWCRYHWKELCKFLNSAFDMDMKHYTSDKEYPISIYDAAMIITYGIMKLDEKNRYKQFLQKIKTKTYSTINVTEWKTFWNLKFQITRMLLAKYIDYDKKEYGFCHHKKRICDDCTELFDCTHCSSISKYIDSNELTINNLLNIRDKLIKVSSQVKNSIQRYTIFLEDKSKHLNSIKITKLISDYLFSLLLSIHKIMYNIILKSALNEYFAFLIHGDISIDCESGKIIVNFNAPQPCFSSFPAIINSKDTIKIINILLDKYFSHMIQMCYDCMIICPSKSPLYFEIEQTNMLSQQGELFKKSLNLAIAELETNFNQEIKELSKNNKK